jgi:hypothetical protein
VWNFYAGYSTSTFPLSWHLLSEGLPLLLPRLLPARFATCQRSGVYRPFPCVSGLSDLELRWYKNRCTPMWLTFLTYTPTAIFVASSTLHPYFLRPNFSLVVDI